MSFQLTPGAAVLGTGTQLIHVGRPRADALGGGYVNPPLVRGTTVLAPSLATWRERGRVPTHDKPTDTYGRFGTPTTQAFEEAMASLENGYRSLCFPSGLAACSHALMAFARPGAHVLIADGVYWPVREFASEVLAALGCEVEYFSELTAAGVAQRLRPETAVVYLESPASLTFEVSDVDQIAERCRRAGVRVVMDNTWATPLLFRPLDHGVDVCVQSATKYIAGHSDCILGVATATREAWEPLASCATRFGQTASPDDLYQGLRGLRTLDVRLQRHGENALHLIEWLQSRPEVAAVYSPVLAHHPGHAAWKRLYRGASGLFSFVLRLPHERALDAFFQNLRLFGIGLSWGGFESLALPMVPAGATVVPAGCQLIRMHAGLEASGDLIDDLQRALQAMRGPVALRA